jgi:acyl carrier protein
MGLDSVEILMKIENTFGIQIPKQEAEKIVTVGDFYDTIWNHLPTGANRKNVESVVNQIISDMAGLDVEEITKEKKIADDLGID